METKTNGPLAYQRSTECQRLMGCYNNST
uniref:Uncharacterized protein n=1 Tax=mine drainage metagenome TaxID=410659 RepID=E6Q5P2_9ZZZZ